MGHFLLTTLGQDPPTYLEASLALSWYQRETGDRRKELFYLPKKKWKASSDSTQGETEQMKSHKDTEQK